MTLVYITCKDRKEALKVSRHLIEKRLVACVNIFPIESLYRWEGRIAEEHEFAVLAKSIDKNYNAIKKEVSRIHSYTIPCVLKIGAEANEPYAEWVKGEIARAKD